MKGEAYEVEVDTEDSLLAHILDAAGYIKKLNINSDQQHLIFIHELQSGTEGDGGHFWNVQCEL